MAYNFLTGMSEDGFRENLSSGDLGGLLGNVWEAARDQYLGIDDARRAITKLREGNFLGALKSLATGGLEIGANVLGPMTTTAKAAKLPGIVRIPAKLFGTGAKTPARGFAINTALNLGMPPVIDAALPRLPFIGRAFKAAPALAMPDPFELTTVSPERLMGAPTSPSAANQEALLQLMMQQGMI